MTSSKPERARITSANIKRPGVFLELRSPIDILLRKECDGPTGANVVNGSVEVPFETDTQGCFYWRASGTEKDQGPELQTYLERRQDDSTIGSSRKHNLFQPVSCPCAQQQRLVPSPSDDN